MSLVENIYRPLGPIFQLDFFGQTLVFVAGQKEIKEAFLDKGICNSLNDIAHVKTKCFLRI